MSGDDLDLDLGLDLVDPPDNPMPNARMFIGERFHLGDVQLLRHIGGAFHEWRTSHWAELEVAQLRALLYERFEHAFYVKMTKDGPVPEPFRPNRHKVADLVEAAQAVVQGPPDLRAPAWLDNGFAPVGEIVPCGNGLLHLPTRELWPHQPEFFNLHAVPFDYSQAAPPPTRWLRFLDELWDGDAESIAALQEWCGYLVSGSTTQQKMLLMVGPKRSGKGTVARVVTQLLGPHNVTGSTLSSLATNFGLAPLVDASVAFISDARLPKTDTSIVTERLLSISGEDVLTVDRKYRDHLTLRLPTRIVIMTNELPRFSETSGALSSRFIVLQLTRTFYGSEDPALTNKLVRELPGIFGWALEGLDRLRRRGYFVQPASAADAIRELEDLASPVGAFVRDRCVVGGDQVVDINTIWVAWRGWCEANGHHVGTLQTFGRNLRAVVTGLRDIRPRDTDGDRFRAYAGVGLRKTDQQ